jgi:predicted membrane-bound spermidine synthase
MTDRTYSEESARPRNGLEAVLIYILVFVCGAVLMGVQFAGSRVLNPHFGSTVFVWGGLISVFMVALAAGYYLGGVVADRMPSFGLLSGIVAVAAFMLIVMPAFAVPLCGGIEKALEGPRAAPLVASTLLFFMPGMLLAMVVPFAVRLSISRLETVGNVTGTLYALSAAGNIAGVLLTAFVLIPVMGTLSLVFALGTALLVTAMPGLAVELTAKRRSP